MTYTFKRQLIMRLTDILTINEILLYFLQKLNYISDFCSNYNFILSFHAYKMTIIIYKCKFI